MFPNFTSLAQREQKRQELLERAQRHVRQSNTKRQMYAGTSWASDITNGVTTIPKKSTESTQTDSSESAESLKKTLIDGYSQTNPEVSTPSVADAGVQANPLVVDAGISARPSVVDAGISAKPSVVDAGISAKPSVVDVGISNTPFMNDTIDGKDGPDKYTLSDDEIDEIKDQKRSKQAVAEISDVYPILVDLRIHPVDANGRQLTKYYIGRKAKTYSIILNKVVLVPSINWSETYDYIGVIITNDVRFLTYINEKRGEDRNTPQQIIQYIGSKRKIVNPSEGDVADRTKQRLEKSFLFDNSSSTTSDQTDSKLKLFWTISKNKGLLESNGLKKNIVPILDGATKTSPIDNDGYVWVDGNSINVYGKESNRTKPAITKEVNWVLSLRSFINMVRDRGLQLEVIGKYDDEIYAKDFAPGDGEAQHGTKSGIDEDMEPMLSNADNDAKIILTDYYTQLQSKGIEIPFRLTPVVETKHGIKNHPTYYFGKPTNSKPLNFMTIGGNKHKQVSGEARKGLMRTIRWMDTFTNLLNGIEDIDRYLKDVQYPFPSTDEQATELVKEKKLNQQRRKNLDTNLKILNEVILKSAHDIKRQSSEVYDHDDNLQKLHDESEAAFQAYGEAQKRYEEAKNTVKGSNSKSARSALKAATSAMKATKAVYLAKSKKYSQVSHVKTDVEDFSNRQDQRSVKQTMNSMLNQVSGLGIKSKLQGRGLRGAGVAPLEGVVRRGRTYNLNEIQGLATPSAYVYRQLGSKYIRIPDLDNKTLVIVQPNRRKCGPKRGISGPLQSMIRTLAFKQHIDQEEYDKLTVDDKKIFKEILAITHLQYNFHDRLEDPLASLRAEYDKLKGELELGNDNPSIIKQLKSLSVDMYSNRLISDSEFKDIIVRLI